MTNMAKIDEDLVLFFFEKKGTFIYTLDFSKKKNNGLGSGFVPKYWMPPHFMNMFMENMMIDQP